MPGRPCPSRNSKDAHTAGGDMRHGLATIGEGQRRDGITATHHSRARTGCHSPRYFDGPLAKWRHFEDAHRTVPDHGARGVQHLAKTSDSRHANIQTLPTGRNALIRHHRVGTSGLMSWAIT